MMIPGVAFAQSGHFVGTPTCTDEGTTAQCTGKVAGLGGTTFEITFTAEGTTGTQPTPRNGQFRFRVATAAPEAPADSCPNPMWTATVVDVEFGDATLTLSEDGVVSDTITVPVS